MLDAGRHPNIEILTNSELVELKGEAGNFHAVVRKHPRYVSEVLCTGCGQCIEDCPVAVVYHASWPDQIVIKGTIKDIESKIAGSGIKKTAMVIVGPRLADARAVSTPRYSAPPRPRSFSLSMCAAN